MTHAIHGPALPRPGLQSGTLSSRLAAVAALAVILLLCLPPLLVGLGRRDATHTMERVALVTSQETWLRQHAAPGSTAADALAWLIPTFNGTPRVTKPPMIVWLNLLAWTGLYPASATADDLVFRARLLTVAASMLALVATFWIGHTLGGPRLAATAALVMGTTIFFQKQARTASYDMHLVAWATLAIAAGLWATTHDDTRRRALGWALGGIALAVAWLIKGPLAVLVTLLPLSAAMVVLRRREGMRLFGLAAMLLLAAALALPWFVYAYLHTPGAMDIWLGEYEAQRDSFQPPWYYLGLFGLVVPWTLWLLAGLTLPFLRARGELRQRILVPCLWFAALFALFSIPGAKQQRYILPILPAASLVVAWLWEYHQRLSDAGEADDGIDLLRIPQWVALVLASVALPVTLIVGGQPVPAAAAIAVGVALLAITAIGARLHWQWRPAAAALAIGVWASLATTLWWTAYSHADSGRLPTRAELVRIEPLLVGRSLGYCNDGDKEIRPDVPFLLYSQQIVPLTTPDTATCDLLAAPRGLDLGPHWQPRGDFDWLLNQPATLWERREAVTRP